MGPGITSRAHLCQTAVSCCGPISGREQPEVALGIRGKRPLSCFSRSRNVENCRLHGVEPCAYLKDVLERLPTTTNQQIAQLTPLNWKLARQPELRRAA